MEPPPYTVKKKKNCFTVLSGQVYSTDIQAFTELLLRERAEHALYMPVYVPTLLNAKISLLGLVL